MSRMGIIVRLGPIPLLARRATRVAELERIVAGPVELVEVTSVAELAAVSADADAVAIVIDATAPGDLTGAIALAGSVPVLRPLWRRVRNSRGEIDEVFDGYGRLTKGGVEPLADAALRRP